jgi:hypothetical protein
MYVHRYTWDGVIHKVNRALDQMRFNYPAEYYVLNFWGKRRSNALKCSNANEHFYVDDR